MASRPAGARTPSGGVPEAPGDGSVTQAHNLSRSWRANIVVVVTLLVCSGLGSGCGNIIVTDRTPPTPAYPPAQRVSNVSDVPNTQEMHDLAVAAVDFDPALDSRQIVMGRPTSLLVAVENKGNRREGPFNVTVQLLTQDRREVLMSAQRTLSMLAAGDVTVVRFPTDTAPPAQRVYILTTQVQTVPQEADTSNNKRTLEIQLNAN
jgi:hypothetical protein